MWLSKFIFLKVWTVKQFPGDFNYQFFSFKAWMWNLNLSKYRPLFLGLLPLSSALSMQSGMNGSKPTCELSSLFCFARRLLHLLPIWHLQVKWSYSLILNSPFYKWTHCKCTPLIPSLSLNDVYITVQSPFCGFLLLFLPCAVCFQVYRPSCYNYTFSLKSQLVAFYLFTLLFESLFSFVISVD